MIESKPIGIVARLTSMLLDYFFITIFTMIVGFMIMGFAVLAGSLDLFSANSDNILICLIFLFLIYFIKDIVKGKSVAKRIFGFIVVDNKTGEIANPIRLSARNITLILWPIEVIFSIISPQRRIGDYVAGTKLIYDNHTLKTEASFGKITMAILMGIMCLGISILGLWLLSLVYER